MLSIFFKDDNLSKYIRKTNLLEMFGTVYQKGNLLVRDRASNIDLGSNLAQISLIHSLIHLLQLVISDSIIAQRSVIDVLAKYHRLQVILIIHQRHVVIKS